MRRYLARDQLRRVQCEAVPFLEQTLNGLVDAAHQNGFNIGRRSFQDQFGQNLRPLPRSLSPADWVSCFSQDAIPAFGLAEVWDGSWDSDLNEWIIQVRKSTGNPQLFAAVEDYDVGAGQYGWCRLVNPYVPRKVNFYGATPAWYDELQVSGTSVKSGNGGQLVCVGRADTEGQVAVLQLVGAPPLKGQTTALHAKGTTQTVNIYRRKTNPKGLETFTAGDTVQAYNTWGTVAGGKWVAVAYIDGGWELIDAEC